MFSRKTRIVKNEKYCGEIAIEYYKLSRETYRYKYDLNKSLI